MPFDEEGNKWSCDPCLRGHRSSKCQHFDRLMAKVPRSGRPSKKCPHSRQNCSCRKPYAIMEPLSYGPRSLCRLVYYVSHNPDNPDTPEPCSPNSVDNWHNPIESDFCAQPPHIPDVFNIISQAPKSPAKDPSPPGFPPTVDGSASPDTHSHTHQPGLGITSLSEGDLMVPTLYNDNTISVYEAQQGIETRGAYEFGYNMYQLGHGDPYAPNMVPSFHGWSSVFGGAP
ncbi:copper fist DNA binding domain-containing protein [Aspergillus granulosus]|uniref:Copper fist DNA binding domain-containing protein n=1 Tax=Aspergillus granulosus TaxID=176169 RepID=A0ABR4HLX4_9EURO